MRKRHDANSPCSCAIIAENGGCAGSNLPEFMIKHQGFCKRNDGLNDQIGENVREKNACPRITAEVDKKRERLTGAD